MDDAARHKKEFPFSTKPLKEYETPILNMLASMEPSVALEFLREHENKVNEEIQSLSLHGDVYEQKLSELKHWIGEAYQVENVDRAVTEMQRKNSDERKSSEDVHHTNGAGENKAKPPTIRLKLQSSTSPSTTATSPVTETAPAAEGRRGSKNLSRMNRPQDSGKSLDLKPKVPNQIPVAVFWNYVEGFFKNIEESDAKYLDDPAKVFDSTPFTIPPLGRHYTDQWREAYGYHAQGPKKLTAATTGAVRMHSLKERLLSMLLEEGDFDTNSLEIFQTPEEDVSEGGTRLSDDSVIALNERIRKDMAEAGLIDGAFVKEFGEDDEICRQINALQQELKRQTVVNTFRKKALYQRVKKYLPAQEFWSLIGELDKQFEQAYGRLAKLPSSKKRKTTGQKSSSSKTASSSGTTSPPPGPANEGEEAALKLLEHRERLMQSIAHTLPCRLDTLLPPDTQEPLFDASVEEKLIAEAEQSGGWMRHAIDSFVELESKGGSLGLSEPISFVVN